MEAFGMGQMEPGVSLYCKKVLIDPKPKKLLPEWMRFVRGVIDSEDLPLNISRESMQDSALVRKIGDVVVRPGSHDAVAGVLALAVEHHLAVVPFGGGT